MTDIPDPLLAAARDLRLRCFMGSLPFDVDAWLAKRPECDLPAPTDGEYHFEVRTVSYLGTYLKLRLGANGPKLAVGGRGTFPATREGLRDAAAELNTSAGSLIAPQKYIWLHGSPGRRLAVEADTEHHARLEQAMINLALRDLRPGT